MGGKRRGQPEPRIVRGTIDRIEGGLAVVVLDDGGQVLWPKDRLAEGTRPGTAVVMAMAADEGKTGEREQEVRDSLRDIFGSPPD